MSTVWWVCDKATGHKHFKIEEERHVLLLPEPIEFRSSESSDSEEEEELNDLHELSETDGDEVDEENMRSGSDEDENIRQMTVDEEEEKDEPYFSNHYSP